jgi:molybdenum cofactor guanylyltransferase
MEPTEITGIVLAGGKSSRFGSDKAMANWNGKRLIENAIDILHPVCHKVIISSNNPEYSFTGCEVCPDELPIQAPMIGIYSCLKRSQTEINIILSCDIPLIPTALLKHLIEKSPGYDAIIPKHGNDQMEPLCGIYKRSLIPNLEKFIEDENYSLKYLLKFSATLFVQINPSLSFFYKDLFVNINTMEDFGKLHTRII